MDIHHNAPLPIEQLLVPICDSSSRLLPTELTSRSSNTVIIVIIISQGCQQILKSLEDPEKPWIFFVPGKIPWKSLKLQPTPEKLCCEADFCAKIFEIAVLLRFLIGVVYVSSLLIGMDSEETIDGDIGWLRGCNTLNAFPPFNKFCNIFVPFYRIYNFPFGKFITIFV